MSSQSRTLLNLLMLLPGLESFCRQVIILCCFICLVCSLVLAIYLMLLLWARKFLQTSEHFLFVFFISFSVLLSSLSRPLFILVIRCLGLESSCRQVNTLCFICFICCSCPRCLETLLVLAAAAWGLESSCRQESVLYFVFLATSSFGNLVAELNLGAT